MENKKNVFLIDGSSFLYRAYYSMKPLHTSKGQTVQAVYGFIRMLKKLIDTYNPEYIACVWDSKGKTQRHEIFSEYKATRQAAPNDLFEQKELIKKFAELINLKQIEKPGIEADDLIYSAAKEMNEQGFDVSIVSSDKDLYQILNPKVRIIDPFKDKITNESDFFAEKGFEVEKLPFFFALLGDTSDNIPGVKGIGQKGAEELVKNFKSLEDLYENLEKVKKESTRKALVENKDNAFLSLDLFLLRYTKLNTELNNFEFDIKNWSNALPLLKELEFKSLVKDINPAEQTESEKLPLCFENNKISFETITDESALDNLIKKLYEASEFAIDTETTGVKRLEDECVGISICYELGKAYYIPFGHVTIEQQLPRDMVIKKIKPLLEDKSVKKILQNAKFDALVFYNMGINLNGIDFDTMIAANLVTKDWQRIGLDKLSEMYLKESMLSYDDVVKKNKLKNFSFVDLSTATKYSASDAHQTLSLMPILKKELEAYNQKKLFYEIEMPLMEVLIEMEINGIKIDENNLKNLSIKALNILNEIENKISSLIGPEHKINLNSPKQVEHLLFNVLLLPTLKKSGKKTGFSTDQSVLENLSKMSPIPPLILKHREISKLLSTYISALPEYVNKNTNKIHTNFSQTTTTTGRLSSYEPNLQNIPAESDELAQGIRASFIAEPGQILISADYSQIELRVLAFLSQDENLLNAFKNGKDIHNLTAAKIFGLDEQDVSSEQRKVGKRINFSILYGLTPYGLSQDLKIPLGDAKKYIEKYFDEYPKITEWMKKIIDFTKENKYVETHWGRRRYIPGIDEKNKMLYEFAKRAAINTVAQGTAAEIMKIGMINLNNKLKEFNAKILLQIHDELLISAPIEKSKEVELITKSTLENVTNWNVPLEVQYSSGKNWLEVSK